MNFSLQLGGGSDPNVTFVTFFYFLFEGFLKLDKIKFCFRNTNAEEGTIEEKTVSIANIFMLVLWIVIFVYSLFFKTGMRNMHPYPSTQMILLC